MMSMTTWFRKVGGALIACLLLALVVVPSLDSAMCASDGDRASAGSVQGTGQVVDADHHESKNQDKGSDVCIHGHCHHASSVIGGDGVLYGAREPLTLRAPPQNLGLPPSSAQERLEEPPRA